KESSAVERERSAPAGAIGLGDRLTAGRQIHPFMVDPIPNDIDTLYPQSQCVLNTEFRTRSSPNATSQLNSSSLKDFANQGKLSTESSDFSVGVPIDLPRENLRGETQMMGCSSGSRMNQRKEGLGGGERLHDWK
ncbi:hypothetical protein JAAARDRAFT_30934, partial [Jaapia argillacea MUCL 33604]